MDGSTDRIVSDGSNRRMSSGKKMDEKEEKEKEEGEEERGK